MSEKVSVVIPVFNAERFLAEALESVLGQTHKDFKLIAINDGSTDKSKDILEQYAKQDHRIEIINQENRGISEVRNRGLRHANTEWVVAMDADDIMYPNRIERQLDFIRRNPKVRVASCMARYIDGKGRIFGTTHNSVPTVEALQDHIRRCEPIGFLHPGVIMHRDTALSIGGYRKAFDGAEDIDLWNRITELGHQVLVQDEVLMKYRFHDGSVVTSKFQVTQMQFQWVRACIKARRRNAPEPTRDEFLAQWEAVPLWTRINRFRIIYCKELYRKAGYAMLTRKIMRGMLLFTLAAFLKPTYALPRMIHQVFGLTKWTPASEW